MIPEIGHIALILALLASLFQVAIPALGFWRRDPAAIQVAFSGAMGFLPW